MAVMALVDVPGAATSYRLLERAAYRIPATPSGLLIRGFGVRVPGGAPVIKALTWWFSQDQSHFHVHSGRLCAPEPKDGWDRWRTGRTSRDESQPAAGSWAAVSPPGRAPR